MTDAFLPPLDHGAACTRRHALKVFAATGGALVTGRLGRSWGATPWGEPPNAILLTEQDTGLRVGKKHPYETAIRQADPTLALEPNGERLWTSWTGLHGDSDTIMLRSFSPGDGDWGPVVPVHENIGGSAGLAFQSEAAFVNHKLLIVWSYYTGQGWVLFARSFDPASSTFGEPCPLSESADAGVVLFHPAVAANGDRALVVWQSKPRSRDRFGIWGRWVSVEGQPLGEPFAVAVDPERDCCRPAVAAAPGGDGFAVAYDRQDAPGTQNIYVTLIDARTSKCGAALPASNHPASDVTPSVAYSPGGDHLWIGWHSNRKGTDGWDVPRWYRLAALRLSDTTWHEPIQEPAGRDLDRRGTVQGFELVRLCTLPGGAVCVLGRPSHNFCLQYYAADGVSTLYRLPEDGWGGRGRFLRGAFDTSGTLWVTRRDLQTNVLHRIDGFDPTWGPPALRPRSETQSAPPRPLAGRTARYVWPEAASASRPTDTEPQPAEQELNLYFGDIHGHSWQSDGMGEPEESFLRTRDVFQDDFHALTDHDRFVGKRLMDGQWQQQKDLVEHYHEPNRFVTLFAQEWTTPRTNRPHGYGHFIVYSADPRIPLFDHGDPKYRDLRDLYAALPAHGAIAIPHHIGWTGIPWDELDPEFTPAVEACSVHGAFEYEGNEPIPHRGGMKGCFLRDGWNRGQRFGVVGGSDQHGLIWHHGVCWKRNAYRAGLTGVWAPELTRDAILDAIRSRRTFATTGVKLRLRFEINGRIMGSAIQTEDPPSLHVDVAVPPEEGKLRWFHIVRNGAVIHTYGGEGQRSRYTFVDEDCPAGATSCYYLRLTLADRNMAWSSPIWVTRRSAIG